MSTSSNIIKQKTFWQQYGNLILILGGIIVGAELYNRPERVEVVPVPVPQTPVVPQAAPAVPAQQYAWYWCPTARAFYPGVATCPVQWEVVMGTSATNPPQPPQ